MVSIDQSQPWPTLTQKDLWLTKVPKNGINESKEQTRGSKKIASRDRMSRATSVVCALLSTKPTTPLEALLAMHRPWQSVPCYLLG